MIKRILYTLLIMFPVVASAQINTDRVMAIGRNALYFEDYVLSIQYFNQVINAKPYLSDPYFYRGLAKINLDDFQGAESDCSEAIERNPFVVSAYQVRGLARIQQNNFAGAIEDYTKALEFAPENIGVWHNMALCRIRQEDYKGAKNDLDKLIAISPRYTKAYLMRGEVDLKQKDTLAAEKDFGKAIEIDRYDADTWASRAILRLQQQRYKDAEADFDHAIRLSTRNSGVYINRALARYHQNNLRGAMSDYDIALDIDPNNFIGHYNRGLLRAQVGDDNRAIQDFNFVIEMEPDNMMAIFNRGLLLDQTGDYKGAIKDYSTVINEYPNFLLGYQYRAQARRKIGDVKGADADEFKVLKAQLDKQNGVDPNKQTADNTENNKTRKKSDKNMDNYRKIVIADDSEVEQRYKSDYRGRVQDRNVTIKLEPMYALTYYEKLSDVKRTVHYHKYIDELNHSKLFPKPLRITNMESPLTEEQVRFHFALIDAHTSDIVADEKNAGKRFMRGLDFYLVQDFASSIDDFTQSILLDDTFFPAYFMRALVRYKQLEYKKAEAGMNEGAVSGAQEVKKAEVTAMDYDIVKNA